jgi:hypothetical protein
VRVVKSITAAPIPVQRQHFVKVPTILIIVNQFLAKMATNLTFSPETASTLTNASSTRTHVAIQSVTTRTVAIDVSAMKATSLMHAIQTPALTSMSVHCVILAITFAQTRLEVSRARAKMVLNCHQLISAVKISTNVMIIHAQNWITVIITKEVMSARGKLAVKVSC